MNKQQRPDQTKKPPPTFSAEDVRQGEIILKRSWQRLVFIAGLVGIILLALLLGVSATV